jgi:hypothetical protein
LQLKRVIGQIVFSQSLDGRHKCGENQEIGLVLFRNSIETRFHISSLSRNEMKRFSKFEKITAIVSDDDILIAWSVSLGEKMSLILQSLRKNENINR